MTPKPYSLTAQERRQIQGRFGAIDKLLAEIQGMLSLIHDQQGLEGEYSLDERREQLVPKEKPNA